MFKIAERIIELRKEKGISQTDLCKALGMSTSAISSYETGNRYPTLDGLNTIAQFFDVSNDYLMGVTDFRERPKSYNDILINENGKTITRGEFNSKIDKLHTKDILQINYIVDLMINNGDSDIH